MSFKLGDAGVVRSNPHGRARRPCDSIAQMGLCLSRTDGSLRLCREEQCRLGCCRRLLLQRARSNVLIPSSQISGRLIPGRCKVERVAISARGLSKMLLQLLLFTATAGSAAALAPHTRRFVAGRMRDSAAKPPRRRRDGRRQAALAGHASPGCQRRGRSSFAMRRPWHQSPSCRSE